MDTKIKLMRALSGMLEGMRVAIVIPTQELCNDTFQDARGVLLSLGVSFYASRTPGGNPTLSLVEGKGSVEFVWCDPDSVQHSDMVIMHDRD